MESHQEDHGGDTLERLSPREAQVLELASLGLTNLQLASRLELSVHAVKFHLAAIYRKLGVGNRTQAVAVYLRATARSESTVAAVSAGDTR